MPENLDPTLCTHIIYAFGVLKDSKLASFEWNDEDTEWSKGILHSIVPLSSKNISFLSSRNVFPNNGIEK